MTMAEKKEAERLRYEGRWKWTLWFGYFDIDDCAVEKVNGKIMEETLVRE